MKKYFANVILLHILEGGIKLPNYVYSCSSLSFHAETRYFCTSMARSNSLQKASMLDITDISKGKSHPQRPNIGQQYS